MTCDVAVIVQARMGSRRLPGKVLADIAGRSILCHCIERLQASGVGPVIVATTTGADDDAVVAEATLRGAGVVRGFRDDVLQRFMMAIATVEARVIIRATADNPAVDIDAASRVLGVLEAERADHVVECGLPVGGAVEAVRVEALRTASARSTDGFDREHVTPYLRHRPAEFKLCAPEVPGEISRPDLRFTVDTPEDLDYMRRVMTKAGCADRLVPLAEIIRAADGIGGHERAA